LYTVAELEISPSFCDEEELRAQEGSVVVLWSVMVAFVCCCFSLLCAFCVCGDALFYGTLILTVPW